MKITILSVGKDTDPAMKVLLEPYLKRLSGLGYSVELIPISPSNLPMPKRLHDEATLLLKRVPTNALVILLDEAGRSYSSLQLAEQLSSWREAARPIVLIIGGAYGVSEEVRNASTTVMRLSDLTLPHQLVRLLIVEQLYRAADINAGGNYHHT